MLGELSLMLNRYITQVHFYRGFSENIYQMVYSGFTWNEFIFFVLRLFVFILKNEGLHFQFIVLYNKKVFIT